MSSLHPKSSRNESTAASPRSFEPAPPPPPDGKTPPKPRPLDTAATLGVEREGGP